jgi:hypothetical protein
MGRFRETKDTVDDIASVVNIYNQITGKNRTVDQHRWEWFSAPNRSESYVIEASNGEVIGHHGLLVFDYDWYGTSVKVGKTENCMIKKGMGQLYPKYEFQIFDKYKMSYFAFLTTGAKGVTIKIRKRTGFIIIGQHVAFVAIIDFRYFARKTKSSILKGVICMVAPIVNLLLVQLGNRSDCQEVISDLTDNELVEIEKLYGMCNNENLIIQKRTTGFLKYRFIDNPYLKYYILKLYDVGRLIGYIIYSIGDVGVVIEDCIGLSDKVIEKLFSRLRKVVYESKLGEAITFPTLENSYLDRKYPGFVKIRKKSGDSVVMLNIKGDNVTRLFNSKDIYFTRLAMEGVV